MPGIKKKNGRAAVFEEDCELVGVESGIEWNDGAAGRDDAEIRGYPPGMVIGEDRQARAAAETALVDPAADRFSHSPQFGIGAAFNLVIALEFEGGIIRPLGLAVQKTVIKGRHGQ
jgi:hypothetical protein